MMAMRATTRLAALVVLGTLAASAPVRAQSPEGALIMESGRLTEIVGPHNGTAWCRAKFYNNGVPLINCKDGAGNPQPCVDTPGFNGLTMRVRDSAGFSQTYRWLPAQCYTKGTQFIRCHGGCEPGGTGTCKATIRDYTKTLAPGWMDFKILPRNLTLIPNGPYVPPFFCEVEFDNGRYWAGEMPPEQCKVLDAPALLRCKGPMFHP